jgi:hypothetical protein
MMRQGYRFDITVLENAVFTFARSLNSDVHHGAGQVVGSDDQVGERHSKHRVDPAQQAVAEIRLLPRLDGIDVCGAEDVNTGKSSCKERLFCLSLYSERRPSESAP